MKNITIILIFAGLGYFFCQAFCSGIDKEIKRQCIVAKDHCEKYGACEERYLKVCENVKI